MTLRVALALAAAVMGGAASSSAGPTDGFTVRVLNIVDHSRRATFRDGRSAPRRLVTYVRVPAAPGPRPLVVFAHGFGLTPSVYAPLLDAWARAGYVVAAPLFPVENARAPGGPDQDDLVNEPADLRFVITRLTSSKSTLRARIDPNRIALAGQSDGAVAALSAAYDRRYLDRRVDAAVILSGAAFAGFSRPAAGGPPLLAVQGTADPLNAPSTTVAYYSLMRRPKFLLWLLGASHLPPYTTHDRWEPVVADATTAFLDHYLGRAPLRPLLAAGDTPGIARIVADP